MLGGCVTSGEDLDENEKLMKSLARSPRIATLSPVARGEDIFFGGGAGVVVCYINMWDNPDPRSKSRPQYSPRDIAVFLEEASALSKASNLSRRILVVESYTGRIRYVIGKRGTYVREVGRHSKVPTSRRTET